MHLCVVSPGYPTSKTIDFVFVDQLCRFIAEKGEKVTIIAPQSLTKSILHHIPMVCRRSIIPIFNGNNITLYRPFYITLGGNERFKKFNARSFNKSVINTVSKIKETPDVCYGHFWEAVFAIYPWAKRYGLPLIASSGEDVVTLHLDYSLNELKDFIGYVNGVISVSTKNKNEIIEAGLATEDRCKVILNAIDQTLFYRKNKNELRSRFGYNEKDFIVVFVGQFTERKGAKRLSKALTSLNDQSIKALFLGKGNEIPDYKGILFKGTVPHDLLPDYLNCADAFVLPTSNEGCSNAIIEAMACGLPIISSDLPFNYDILNEGNSILVNPYDISAIANAITFLKEHPVISHEMSVNAIKTSSNLTLSKRAEKIIEHIHTLINRFSKVEKINV